MHEHVYSMRVCKYSVVFHTHQFHIPGTNQLYIENFKTNCFYTEFIQTSFGHIL